MHFNISIKFNKIKLTVLLNSTSKYKQKGHNIDFIRNCQYQDEMDKFKARDKPLKLIQSYIHTCIHIYIQPE